MPEVLEVGADGEIRHELFVVVRSRSLYAQIVCALFAVCRHLLL